jgi:hypothetical protein
MLTAGTATFHTGKYENHGVFFPCIPLAPGHKLRPSPSSVKQEAGLCLLHTLTGALASIRH